MRKTIRCSKCGRFVKNVTYDINETTDTITNVEGFCSKCGIVELNWDCYEDLVGEAIEEEKEVDD